MAEFEIFSRALLPLKREPMVTIQKNGIISLNKAALTTLGSPAAIELMFDQRSRTVGLRGADPASENAYTVRSATSQGSGPFVISAMAFLHFYNVDSSVSRRWLAYVDDDILCVDLDDESTVVTSNRADKTRSAGCE